MAQNIVAESANSVGAREAIRSQRGIEIVRLTGTSTAAGDTSNAYRSRLDRPAICLDGSFTVSVSGQDVTFTSLIALGTNVVHVVLAEAQ